MSIISPFIPNSRAYLRRVKKAGIVTSELRALFLAQLAQEQTDNLKSIRGVSPDFDLDNYAERVKTRYKDLQYRWMQTEPESVLTVVEKQEHNRLILLITMKQVVFVVLLLVD